MKRYQNILRLRAELAAILTVSSALLIAIPDSALAKRGGGGGGSGGGGGEDPAPPALVAPPVTYHVTIPGIPADFKDLHLTDINVFGDAVGYASETGTGVLSAMLARADGTVIDLNDVFSTSLEGDFPGWHFSYVLEINSTGLVAGGLVPVGQTSPDTSTEDLIVVGNVYAADPSLQSVAWFGDDRDDGVLSSNAITDMNERGDLVV